MLERRKPDLLLAAAVLTVAIPTIPEQARDVDVLLYMSAAARAHAEGALPYVAAWIEKGPLAMAGFQALEATFGPYPILAVFLTWLALAMAGAFAVRALARELGAGTWPSVAAGLVFVTCLPSVGGTPNTELPAAVAATAATIVWLRTREGGAAGAIVAGLLASAALLCRQNAGVVWAVLAACDLLAGRPRRAMGLTLGFAAPVAAVAALYAGAGAWEAFRFCVWDYNRDVYVAATHVTAERMLRSPLAAWENFLRPVLAASIPGGAGIALAVARFRREPAPAIVAALALAATLAMFPGLRFFSHYFALALPFWAALAGWMVSRVPGRGRKLVAGTVGALLLAQAWGLPWGRGFERTNARVRASGSKALTMAVYWPGRDGLAAETAGWLRDRSRGGDRLFVWGKRPHLYVYSGLVPATRFVTCTFLTGLVPWERVAPHEDTTPWIVPGSWDLLLADLEQERPRFIVDASQDHLFGDGAYAVDRFPRLRAFLDAGYAIAYEAGTGDRMIVWERR
ncbi:MAG TPA: hypothetical protein VF139_01795 [Candidatus Polarisedimenticolaceae bacterium]